MPTENRTNGHSHGHEADSESDQSQTKRQRARSRPYTPRYAESPRRPSAEREDAFNALAWMIEGAAGVIDELRHNDLGLSEDFWVHAYAARRESLLALRAVIDELIAKAESAEQAKDDRQKRRDRRGGIDIEP